MSALTAWDNFYVIVGSSAGALIGLQFVVITLVADLRTRSGSREIGAFSTPTIVHFACVLLLSGVFTAPWHRLLGPAVVLESVGLFGIVYSVVIARRAGQQSSYTLVFEDWLFHVLLPVVAYTILAGAPWAFRADAEGALFAVGTAALLLLFIGIHNAWDTVIYLVVVRRGEEAEKPGSEPPSLDQDRGRRGR